jgi:activating signal cointegrator complex subunit 1
VDRFASAGLMNKEYDHVKLHVTVMNTLMRKDPAGTGPPSGGQRGHNKDRESFDANKVLQV